MYDSRSRKHRPLQSACNNSSRTHTHAKYHINVVIVNIIIIIIIAIATNIVEKVRIKLAFTVAGRAQQ